jgi:hypothetical protein
MGKQGTYKVRGISVGASPMTTGNIFFVDSNNVDGDDTTNSGPNPNIPFITIDYAVGQCTASNGDVIYVMPGHNETIVSATSLVVDVAGVSIIGLGRGRNRPVLDFDDTAGSIEMDAANTRLSNIVLNASVSAVVIGVNVDADDVELDNLEFTFEATGNDFVTMIDVDAFDRATIANCFFRAESGAAGAAEAIRLDDCHYVRITDNQFTGQWSDAAIIGEGAAGTDLLVANNFIYNADTTDSNAIDLKVNILGKGGGWKAAPRTELRWGVNDIVEQCELDAVFNFHDMNDARYRELYAKSTEVVNETGVEFFGLERYDFILESKEYPLEDIVNHFNTDYFSNGICHMIAYAIYTGKTHIVLYGVNMTSDHEYLQNERPCVEYWVGRAQGAGIRVDVVGQQSDLLQTRDARVYGYDYFQDSAVPV